MSKNRLIIFSNSQYIRRSYVSRLGDAYRYNTLKLLEKLMFPIEA